MQIQDLPQQRIAILWYGREGKAMLDFLLSRDVPAQQITLLDKSAIDTPTDQIATITGDTYLESLDDFDLIIRSAGISPYQEALRTYHHKLTTQTQLFFDNYHGQVIGITGTKGKSTTASLIYQMLLSAGCQTELVGNLGIPVLAAVDLQAPPERLVFELSSYQLDQLSFSIEIGLVTNLYPEHHITRHGWWEHYCTSKFNLCKAAKQMIISQQVAANFPDQLSLLDDYQLYDTPSTVHRHDDYLRDGERPLFSTRQTTLAGAHNMSNLAAATSILLQIGIDPSHAEQTANKFVWLPHRLQQIGIYGGVRRVDDAISTTPTSTIAALNTLWEQVETIFLGGSEGPYEFEQLVDTLHTYGVKQVVLFPESGKRVLPLLDDSFVTLTTSSMREAVGFAAQVTTPGKTVLLSCASPSYSLWTNFEQKGDEFQQAIAELCTPES